MNASLEPIITSVKTNIHFREYQTQNADQLLSTMCSSVYLDNNQSEQLIELILHIKENVLSSIFFEGENKTQYKNLIEAIQRKVWATFVMKSSPDTQNSEHLRMSTVCGEVVTSLNLSDIGANRRWNLDFRLFPNLQNLDLSCVSISEHHFNSLSHCKIVILKLRYWKDISQSIISKISNCFSLKEIDFSNSTFIPDAILVLSNTHVERVVLANCDPIKPDNILKLLSENPHLIYIDVTNCFMSREQVKSLKLDFPKCDIDFMYDDLHIRNDEESILSSIESMEFSLPTEKTLSRSAPMQKVANKKVYQASPPVAIKSPLAHSQEVKPKPLNGIEKKESSRDDATSPVEKGHQAHALMFEMD